MSSSNILSVKWLVYTLIISVCFVMNPQRLEYVPGSQSGKYIDGVDSFSEYLIRNTVKNQIIGIEHKGLFPIITNGYGENDFTYRPEGTRKYFSNPSIQATLITFVAQVLPLKTEADVDSLLDLFRLFNALLFASCLCYIVLKYCAMNGFKFVFITPVLLAGFAGFVFYAQNLYFMASFMVLPSAICIALVSRKQKVPWISLFLLSLLFFLRGYEFATIFALLNASVCFLFMPIGRKFKSAVGGFVTTVVAFFVAIFIHLTLIVIDSGGHLSYIDAPKIAFKSLARRVSSAEGVPLPFSADMFLSILDRLSYVGYTLGAWFRLTELQVLVVFLVLFLLKMKRMTPNALVIFFYGLFGYLSWYIFAYQHIMWHGMYDWYVFSLTVGMATTLFLLESLNYHVPHLIDWMRGIFDR